MPKNVKHYLLTALILGGVAAVSGAAIALTYFATINQININDAKRIEKGLLEIYNDATFSEPINIEADKDSYLECYYEAKKDDNLLGYVFRTSGKNDYGKITMLVGISTSYDIGHISLIVNEQSYAQTLVDSFVEPYNHDKKQMNDEDVTCGATFGATLVKNMAEEAKSWAEKHLGGGQ